MTDVTPLTAEEALHALDQAFTEPVITPVTWRTFLRPAIERALDAARTPSQPDLRELRKAIRESLTEDIDKAFLTSITDDVYEAVVPFFAARTPSQPDLPRIARDRGEPPPIDLDDIEMRWASQWNESDDGEVRAWRDDVAALIDEVRRLRRVSNGYFEEMVRRTPGSTPSQPDLREALSFRVDRALAVEHRDDDGPCSCDECMSYGAEDEGFDWYRAPAANRVAMRILDGDDSRLAPLRQAFADHDAALSQPAPATVREPTDA